MTRFDAATPTERRKLIADAVLAHRKRNSAYLTVEAEPRAAEGGGVAAGDGSPSSDVADTPDTGGSDTDAVDSPAPPWVQFADQTFNLDCSDAELEALKSLLNEFPEFRIEQLEQPEQAEGTNVRVSARADPNRLAMFVDRVFQAVYGHDEAYRVWVVEV